MVNNNQNTRKLFASIMLGFIVLFLLNEQTSQVDAFAARLTSKFTLLHHGHSQVQKKCERKGLEMSSESTLQDVKQKEVRRIKKKDSDKMTTTILAFFLSSWIVQKRLPIFSTIISLLLFVGNAIMNKSRIKKKNRYDINNYTTTNQRQSTIPTNNQETEQRSPARSRYHLAEIAAREEKRAFFGKKWVEETLRCTEETLTQSSEQYLHRIDREANIS